MTKAQEIGQMLTAKRQELATLMKTYEVGTHPIHGVPLYEYPAGMEVELDNRTKELEQLTDDYTALARAETAQKNERELAQLNLIGQRFSGNPGLGGGGGNGYAPRQADLSELKSLGQRVVESVQYKTRGDRKGAFTFDAPDVDLQTLLQFKTLMQTGVNPGYAAPNPRTSLVVPFPNRPLRVVDLIPITPTDVNTVKWMEETTFTNNASMTGEGYTKPESTLDWTERTSPVRKIAHVMHITDEVMEDIPGFMSLINNDMVLMLGLKEETQIILGSGIGQELTGFLNVSTINSQAFSTNNADTILKAMTKVQWTGYGNVTAILMHPSNWETTRLIKGATNQDYVLGSPLIDVSPRLWGVPVVITNAITQNTALVGDFAMFSEIRRKMGVTVDVATMNGTDFVENKLLIRAEMREALLVKRGSAFTQATALT